MLTHVSHANKALELNREREGTTERERETERERDRNREREYVLSYIPQSKQPADRRLQSRVPPVGVVGVLWCIQ